MSNADKTKEELIKELQELQQEHNSLRFLYDKDITELKHAETEIKLINEELSKINAEKDKFFSIIAHDLRSSLGAFRDLTEMIADNSNQFTLDETKELTESMSRSARNIFNLLENLLEWSRMQRGIIPFMPELLHLSDIVNESIATVAESAKIKGIELTLDISNSLSVYADANMLGTIIRNLASNALKFTLKGGKVTICAKQIENNRIEVSVKDTGIGMNPEMIGNLFQLDVDTGRLGTDGELSTGLGLHLCNEFVIKHRGKIWAESEEEKGSIFYFTIPSNAELEE